MKKKPPKKHGGDARKQARLFDSLLSVTADFNYIFDRKGRFSYINQALLDLLGLTREQAVGRNFHDLNYPPELAARLQAQIEQVFVTGKPLKDETPFTNPEGKWGHYEYIFVPILDEMSRVEAVAGSTRDISAHKRAQMDLKASEDRFKQLAEISTFGLVIGKLNGGLHYANATIQNLLGYSDEEFREGRVRWDHLTPPEFAAKDMQAIQELTATGRCRPYEKEFLTKDGRRIPILVGASKLTTSDDSTEIAAYIIDLSAVHTAESARRQSDKRLEELNRDLEKLVTERTEQLRQKDLELLQAQKLEAIGRLSGGVAHDFNNLITGILGITEDLREQFGPDSPHQEDLQEIIKAGHKASSLTRQLLAFGRRQITAQKILNVNTVITDMTRMFGRLLGEDIEVVTALDPRLGNIRADQSQLEQIVVNLMLNARDAISGSGRIHLKTANIDLNEAYMQSHFDIAPGSYVCLTFSDSGSGMKPDTLNHIFEPFFTTKEQGKGTGLGLATVYGIVKQNNGDISVYSELGKGTTFKIYLPRVSDIADFERRKSERGTGPGGSEKILVVEDEDIVRRVAVRALKKRGYTVLEAKNGADALDIVNGLPHPIDLLVTDVVMPGMNGRLVAQRIGEKQPGVRVLFMSGHAQEVMFERGIVEPGIAFIEKSFSADAFCRKVREVLDTVRNRASSKPPPTSPTTN
jgi:two-component system, cell cycle sensor histidine kinase and response regulator CckA